jgi:hypothetical protein
MFCPKCRQEYRSGFFECADCRVPLVDRLSEPEERETDDDDLGALIQTSLESPVAITLVESLLQEAGIPFFVVNQNVTSRQEGGNFLGWWSVRVPRRREAEAREMLASVEKMR